MVFKYASGIRGKQCLTSLSKRGLIWQGYQDSYLFRGIEHTRAFQEFSLLEKMCAWRLPVPRPIAIQIEKRFCCYRADIIIEKSGEHSRLKSDLAK